MVFSISIIHPPRIFNGNFIFNLITINNLRRTQERQFNMNALIDHRKSEFRVWLVNDIIYTRRKNRSVIRRYNGMRHIKVCTAESTVIVVSLTRLCNMDIAKLLRNNHVF